MRVLVLAALIACAPTMAMSANYWMLKIDRQTLSVTDLRSPRNLAGMGTAFEIVINRKAVKAGKGVGDYTINRFDISCAQGKISRNYTAQYDATGMFQASKIKPSPWSAVKPDTTDDALRNLACSGAMPRTGVALGDLGVRAMLERYRSGVYDRYIR